MGLRGICLGLMWPREGMNGNGINKLTGEDQTRYIKLQDIVGQKIRRKVNEREVYIGVKKCLSIFFFILRVGDVIIAITYFPVISFVQ